MDMPGEARASPFFAHQRLAHVTSEVRTTGGPSQLTADSWQLGRRGGGEGQQSHRSESNRRPLDYESRALPLSYGGAMKQTGRLGVGRCPPVRRSAGPRGGARGGGENALARIRTGTALATAPSRQRVYQFHHQGAVLGPSKGPQYIRALVEGQ